MIKPPLDPNFQPAILWRRAFDQKVADSGSPKPCLIALEQADGSVFHHETQLLPAGHPEEDQNFRHVERLVKFLLWSTGCWRVHMKAPIGYAARLDDSKQRQRTI